MKIEDKSKKILIILAFTIVACLSALNQLKEASYFNIINEYSFDCTL